MSGRRGRSSSGRWSGVLRTLGTGAWAWTVGLSFGGLMGFFVGMFITWLRHR